MLLAASIALHAAGNCWLLCTPQLTCMQVEGMKILIDDLVGSTGMELKADPGVPYVYAGFAGECAMHVSH